MKLNTWLLAMATVSAMALTAVAPSFAATRNSGTASGIACGSTDITLSYSPTTLWPPNHKMQTITIIGSDTDADGDMYSITVTNITENQSEVPGMGCGKPTDLQGADDSGIGNTSGMVTDPALASTSVQVRSERCAAEGARTYDITVSCMENSATEMMKSGSVDLIVTVPHDQGHHHGQ
jgi:hypothetical protein